MYCFARLDILGEKMFIKIGDNNPITIVNPADIDDAETKKSLNKTVKSIKNIDNKIVVKKDVEKK